MAFFEFLRSLFCRPRRDGESALFISRAPETVKAVGQTTTDSGGKGPGAVKRSSH